jgi:hypothetical protein
LVSAAIRAWGPHARINDVSTSVKCSPRSLEEALTVALHPILRRMGGGLT